MRRPSRLQTGFLAVFLLCSPGAALRMLHTLHLKPITEIEGACIAAKLGAHRKTPPLPIETQRPLKIRKAEASRFALPFERTSREGTGLAGGAGSDAQPSCVLVLRSPSYLRIFLASTPQNPVYPPDSDPAA
jgi:hypothetical protein